MADVPYTEGNEDELESLGPCSQLVIDWKIPGPFSTSMIWWKNLSKE